MMLVAYFTNKAKIPPVLAARLFIVTQLSALRVGFCRGLGENSRKLISVSLVDAGPLNLSKLSL